MAPDLVIHVPDVFIQCIQLVALQATSFEDIDHGSLDAMGETEMSPH